MRGAPWLMLAACGFGNTVTGSEPQPEIDSRPIDAAPDAPAEQLCAARYGALEDYELCATTITTCRFYVRTNGGSCDALCASKGGTCMSSHDGDCNSTPQIRECTRTLSDQVCTCTQ